jgi:hypothetical protein
LMFCVVSSFLHHFFEPGFGICFSWICHGFWDGFVMEFPSFFHTDIAPVPNLANLVFEQQYCVLRSKSSFYLCKKTCFSMIVTPFFATNLCIVFL